MGKRAPHDDGVQQARTFQVVDITAAPGEEAGVFEAMNRGADIGVGLPHGFRCASRLL
jgi:hypothetical protein